MTTATENGFVGPYTVEKKGATYRVVDANGEVRATETTEKNAAAKRDKWNGEDGDSPGNGKPSLPAEAVETSKELKEILDEPDAPPEIGVGLHADLPMEGYLAIDAASNTALSWLKRSPAHLKAYTEEDPTFVDPDSVGSALHALVLEGREAFDARYAKGEGDNRSLAWWKAKDRDPETNAWLAEDGRILLRESDFDAVVEMARRVMDHPAARHALEGVTLTEVTGVWIDPETGVKCKLRADAINPKLGLSIDLKSTRDAEEDAFSRAVWNYGYHRQGGLYQKGLEILLPEVDWKHHVIIAQEKKLPYAVQAFRIEDETMEQGRREVENLLARYDRCMKEDHWPGYSESFVTVSLPGWVWNRIEDEFEAEVSY